MKPERELEKEQREAAPGVMGVWGALRPSAVSSAMRKARPRARGSMIWWDGEDAGSVYRTRQDFREEHHSHPWRLEGVLLPLRLAIRSLNWNNTMALFLLGFLAENISGT